MNLHVPQSIVTEHELRAIAAVPFQIMSPKECKPLVAVVQDVALGIYRLTKKHVTLSEKQMFNLMSTNSKFFGVVPEAATGGLRKAWTGKQALSAIMPPTLNLRSANNSYDESFDDKDNFVIIENGEIKQGTIDKKIYQNRTKGLIHSIYNDCNEEETRHFFDNTQKLICNWLVQSGFSVGISDLIVDAETQDSLKLIIHDMKVQVYDIIKNIHMGKFENNTITNNHDYFESEINKILNKAREQTGKKGLSKINDLENRLINMIKSGSKGSVINVAQMIACVGQQNVDGKRIPYGFDNRTLPHYVKYDDGPDSRGFVENSFISGLSPQEFFFHSMGGREGLIDTAVKTADTGYLQRKLIKAMEDCKISFDYTVRNANGSIVQFLYGEDGIDPIKIESQALPYIDMDYAKLKAEYLLTPQDDLEGICTSGKSFDEAAYKEHFDQIMADREFMIVHIFKRRQNSSLMCPVSFARIIANAKATMARYGVDKTTSDLTAKYVLETINNLGEELFVSPHNRGNKFIQILIRAFLSPKQVLIKHRFSKDIFDHIIQQVRHRYFDAIANPSEMVGVVAAQSIGEPCTQLSCERSTKVLISNKDRTKTFYGKMGDFIDKMLDANSAQVVDLGHDSVVFDPSEDYYVVGVSDTETTSWRRILQVSRHPANGGMVRVHTRSGKTTCATLSHSFLQRTTDRIVPVKGSELKTGDRIPVARHIPQIPDAITEMQGFKLTKDLGWFIGMYLADGNVNGNQVCISKIIPEVIAHVKEFAQTMFGATTTTKRSFGTIMSHDKVYESVTTCFRDATFAKFLLQHFQTGSFKKQIPGWVYTSNTDFICGLLAGYFDGDGNVADIKGKGMIRAHSVNEALIDSVIILLAYTGIFASKTIEHKADPDANPLFSIQASRKYAKTFADKVGFTVKHKQASLNTVIEYVEREDAHDHAEYIDKIPELGHVIAQIGKDLELPGQSRNYGRWKKKESIGRSTLEKYVKVFEEANAIKKLPRVHANINILKQAAFSSVVWDEIVKLEYLEDPKEFVYDFTVPGNDSFMVDTCVLVHNTLNSVEWNTELLLKVNDNLERVAIGDFIDKVVARGDVKNTESHPHDTTLVWIKEQNVKILSCDEEGKIRWEDVEAVTQHPVVNKDGSKTLLKVTLQSGRSVVATKAKSFLKRHNNRIVEINGDELRVGDYLPISAVLPVDDKIQVLDVSQYLPKDEFTYMSEVERAKLARSNGGFWWKNRSFTLPYKHSDSFVATFINDQNSQHYEPSCVYPKKCHNTTTTIPENIPLDEEFGFILGAYAAEGCVTSHHVLISNVDNDFNRKVDSFCQRYKIGYHIDQRIIGTSVTKTLRLHSLVLAQLFERMIGTGSSQKRLPAWALQAPLCFMQGLIDGYFSGDGSVTKDDRNVVSACSTSKGLIEDVQQILLMFGVHSTISLHDTPRYELKRNRFASTQMAYKMTVSCTNTSRFCKAFNLTIQEKQKRLEALSHKSTRYDRGRFDVVPDVVTEAYGSITLHRDKVPELLKDPKLTALDKEVVARILTEDIMYDQVVSIEEVVSEHPFVYDLTVSNTKNFNVYNGIAMRDTFHHSGISSASKAVRGVPRIKELLSVTKNMKGPAMTIHLQDDIKQDKMKANAVLRSIQTTYFKDLVKSSKIYYDAKDFSTGIEEDRLFVQTYNELMDMELVKRFDNTPWLLRFEVNRDKLLEEGLTMIQLYNMLQDYYDDTIACMFSDDNSGNLIFRIRLIEDNSEDRDYITELKALEKNIMDNIIIKGVKNIHKAMMNKHEYLLYNEETLHFDKTSEWILDTSGNNMVEVMSHPGVDYTKTISNDINEIYDLLGIEAARGALYNELSGVIADAELYVNYRHMALLVDTMTNRGYMLSVDRHGINRVDIGPLAKCSFEETTDMLIKAGIFSEVDKITGVSANIMLGQIPPCGTGDTDILIDEHKLMNMLEEVVDDETPEEVDEELCTLDHLSFDFTVPAANPQEVLHVNDFDIKVV